MPRNKKPQSIELLREEETAIVPAGNPLETMVANVVRKMLEGEHVPRSRAKTVFQSRQWSLYFEKWGCRTCHKKNVAHSNNGFCLRCSDLFAGRIKTLEKQFELAMNRHIETDIENLTRSARGAEQLFGTARRIRDGE